MPPALRLPDLRARCAPAVPVRHPGRQQAPPWMGRRPFGSSGRSPCRCRPSRPAATFRLVLVFSWSEYLLALFLIGANTQTLPLTIAAQNATRGAQWWYVSVLILIMILPVIGTAIALERFIARELLVSALERDHDWSLRNTKHVFSSSSASLSLAPAPPQRPPPGDIGGQGEPGAHCGLPIDSWFEVTRDADEGIASGRSVVAIHVELQMAVRVGAHIVGRGQDV